MPVINRSLRCLLTAGPTREHLDPVRFLSNGSSGKMGFALAAAAVARGWEVDLVSGPVALPAPDGVRVHRVVSAADILAALELVPTVDILKTLAALKRPDQVVVGFAAETNDVEAYACRKLSDKRLDWIVANDVSQAGIGMNADNNAVLLLGANGARRAFGPAPKTAVAEFILAQIAP